MNYLPMMTDDEIEYVCSVIPLQDSIQYFKRRPKDFAKVMPGFRATSLTPEKVSVVLLRNRSRPFISSFIEEHISGWLDQIQQEISQLMGDGESKESAWLQTLPFCFFVDNVRIFFKLINEEVSNESVSILERSIKKIRDLEISRKKLEDLLSGKTLEHSTLADSAVQIQADLGDLRKELNERTNEVKALKRANTELEKQNDNVRAKEKEIERLETWITARNNTISQLQARLSTAASEQRQLEIRIEEIETQRVPKLIEQTLVSKPKCPKDVDEFRDYFGYNLEDLGLDVSNEYYLLIRDYLCEILFTGKPILVSRATSTSLASCVSNALVSSKRVATLNYNPNISPDEIEEFLSSENRILCLDNFIGNFDEMILTMICERHKDKIVFITIAYEKTLRYVPEAFFKYCHYLNANRIEAFAQPRELTEDPSFVEETETDGAVVAVDVTWASLLKDILEEIGVCGEVAVYKTSLISGEKALIQLLAFDILPYCVDVLNISPYTVSARLNKYAGDKGRCAYKELFRRWFL